MKRKKFKIIQNKDTSTLEKIIQMIEQTDFENKNKIIYKINADISKMNSHSKKNIKTESQSVAADKPRKFNLIIIKKKEKYDVLSSLSIGFLFYLKEKGNQIDHFDEKMLNFLLFNDLNIIIEDSKEFKEEKKVERKNEEIKEQEIKTANMAINEIKNENLEKTKNEDNNNPKKKEINKKENEDGKLPENQKIKENEIINGKEKIYVNRIFTEVDKAKLSNNIMIMKNDENKTNDDNNKLIEHIKSRDIMDNENNKENNVKEEKIEKVKTGEKKKDNKNIIENKNADISAENQNKEENNIKIENKIDYLRKKYEGKKLFKGTELIEMLKNPLKFKQKIIKTKNLIESINKKITDLKREIGYQNKEKKIEELIKDTKKLETKIQELIKTNKIYIEKICKSKNIEIQNIKEINKFDNIDFNLKEKINNFKKLLDLDFEVNEKIKIYEDNNKRFLDLKELIIINEKKVNDINNKIKIEIEKMEELIKISDIFNEYKSKLKEKIKKFEYKQYSDIFNLQNINKFKIDNLYEFLNEHIKDVIFSIT